MIIDTFLQDKIFVWLKFLGFHLFFFFNVWADLKKMYIFLYA